MPTLTPASSPATPWLPVLLSHAHLTKSLGDPKFFESVPEYRPLQGKAQVMHVDLNSKRGCGSCNKRRVANTLFNDFITITLALSPDGRSRLKNYLGTPTLVVNVVKPDGHVEMRAL